MNALIQKLNTSTGKWEASELTEDDLPDDIGGGSQLDIAEKTLYVCSPFTTEGQFYDNIEDAITDADADGNAHTIEIWGVHSGNFDFGIHTAYLHPLAEIKPYNTAFPAVYLGGGDLLGDGIVTDGGVTMTNYLVEVTEDARIAVKSIYGDYGAINLSGFTGGSGRFIDIDVDVLGKINYDSATAPVYVTIETGELEDLSINGHADATFNISGKEFIGKAEILSSTVILDIQSYLTTSTRLLEVSGGSVIVKGRLADYDNATATPSGSGYPILLVGGELRLYDFQGKNQSGGLIFCLGGTLTLGNAVLEAGNTTGGSKAPIDSPAPFDVLYNTKCGFNEDVGININELIADNIVVDGAITI